MAPDLVGTTEICTMLGVSRQRVTQRAATATFPEPLARLAAGPIWEREVVEAWARRTVRRIVDENV